MNNERKCKNYLKLFITHDYSGGYRCIDDNYDGAPDAGRQTIGSGQTKIDALANYLQDLDDFELLDSSTDYIISGEDLKC
jgi:hypothetical protein